MFSLVKEVCIVLLSFCSSLATKCVSLNDKPCMIRQPCMVRPVVINLNPVELNIIHLEVVISYLQKYVFQRKQKTNVKAFNMITKKK